MSEVKRYHFESFIDSYYKHRQFVLASDYDTLAAEAQALREEVAALRARVVVVPDAANDRRKSAHYCRGWNACLDELARLNGLTVSEDLLRRIERECRRESDWNCENVPAGTKAATTRAKKMLEIANDLRTLLSEQEGGKP
ncbi:hypothetical protein [Pseudomonas paraeruginosa]|uniref:hypothetical protein n=1 Tax=Pseudomonas paraeruginosa TaxID=2994495 RepID=UPI003748EAB0